MAAPFHQIDLHLVQGALGGYDRRLFVKQHSGGDGVAANAVFVAGLPYVLHSLEALLRGLFGAFGTVSSVAVHPAQTTALVAFAGEGDAARALQAAAQGKALRVQLPEPEQPYGLRGWVEAHKASFKPLPQLQQELDEWVAAFEAREQEVAAAAAGADGEEGWTKVVRRKGRQKGGKGAQTQRGGAVASAAAQQRAHAKQAPGLADFYKFQAKEKRRNELAELRSKFAEDKRRLAQLKAQRNFQPY